MVTLTLVASLPRTRIPVYPTPAPASEVVTTDGNRSNKNGRSCPKLVDSILSFEMFVNGKGDLSLLRVALSNTSYRGIVVVESCDFTALVSCDHDDKDASMKIKTRPGFFGFAAWQ